MRLLAVAAGLVAWNAVVAGVGPELHVAASGAAPFISSLKPSSGPAGTSITVSGKGFTPTAGFMGSPDSREDYGGNTVRLGSDVTVKNLNSADGTTVTFDIPQNVAPGVYSVTIVNSNGTSNSVNLTVTEDRH